jgi:hypothetical protein
LKDFLNKGKMKRQMPVEELRLRNNIETEQVVALSVHKDVMETMRPVYIENEEGELNRAKSNNRLNEMCLNCSSSSLSSPTAVSSKRDDKTTRDDSCGIPLNEFLYLQCNKNLCEFGGRCVQKTTIEELKTMREKLWGCLNSEPPTASDRKEFIDDILRASFVKHDQSFKFIAGGVAGNYNLVCEAGYLILLGLSKNRNASQSTYQWKTAKNRVLGKTTETLNTILHSQEQLDRATAYIEFIASKYADTSPFAGL